VERDDGLTQPAGSSRTGSDDGTNARDRGEEGPQANGAALFGEVRHPVRRLVRPHRAAADQRLAPGSWRTLTLDEVRSLYAAALTERDRDAG
jgi:hypothetical protein